jgi:tetratricopeptide (TPR) repeat protein
LTTVPQDANAHFILGWLYSGDKQYRAAEPELLHALELDPKLERAYVELANLYQVEGDTDKAISQYKKLLSLNPRLASIQVLVGNLYLGKNDLSAARKSYEAALASDPHSGLASANLAWVYVLQGADLNVARGLAQNAKRQFPALPSVSDTLAWIYYLQGNFRGALPLLQDCVHKAPDHATYRYHLGMVELAGGDKKNARSHLETALKLKLAGDEAIRARQALQQIN